MALTVTSGTLGIDSLVATGTVTGHHATVYNLYAKYTKGDESTCTLSIGGIKGALSASDLYKMAVPNTATVAQQVYTLSATGNWVIPFTVGKSVDKIVVTIATTGSTATGTLVINGFSEQA